MNPLLATCGIGLLSMGMGAALTPDVLPTPVVPAVVVSDTVTREGAAGAPTRAPTPSEVEPPELDIEIFSRRVLPVRPEPLATLTHAAIDARIRGEVMTPLARRSLKAHNFSRVRLPRTVFKHEFEQRTGGPQARKSDYVAFRLTRTTDIPRLDKVRLDKVRLDEVRLDKPELVARGRVHRQTGAIELRFVADAEEVWYPTEAALKRLARLR